MNLIVAADLKARGVALGRAKNNLEHDGAVKVLEMKAHKFSSDRIRGPCHTDATHRLCLIPGIEFMPILGIASQSWETG
jgi:hypothetical protein